MLRKLDVVITESLTDKLEKIFGENAFAVICILILALLIITALAVVFGVRSYLKKHHNDETVEFGANDDYKDK